MNTQQLPWKPLRTGVQHKLLDRRSDQDLQLDLMQLEPNAQLPLHQHPKFEWAYVLRGSFTDHRGTFTAGDFILNEAGSQHEASTGAEGAELLVVWCGRVTSVNV
jgi:anti-sigma factor ChrR (cupin superfamily)